MKKILAFIVLPAIISCNSGTNQTEVASMKSDSASVKTPDVTYPYPVAYSSKFEISDDANAKKILELWKDWDNGDLSAHKDYFADSVHLYFADGTAMHGPRDSIVASAQAFRNSYKSVTSHVDAVVPLKSADKNEQWVCIWGGEVSTDSKGKTDSTQLMETWRINKDGKTDLLYQYKGKPAPMPAQN